MNETRIRKGVYGWCAETEIKMPELGDNRVLDITTMKRSSGALVTTATVNIRDGMWVTHRVFEDFQTTLDQSRVRCTEAAVRAQHERALARLSEVKGRACIHYSRMLEAA